jgi:hypothetical protein
LSFQEGDILTINDRECVGWLTAKLDGKVGLIPENYVAISSDTDDSSGDYFDDDEKKYEDEYNNWINNQNK